MTVDKFDIVKFHPAQQGLLDGFCGLYSAVNFLCRRKGINPGDERALIECQQVFQSLLESLFLRRKISASRMVKGFQEGHLQKAVNEFCRNDSLPIKAFRLETWATKHNCKDIFDLVAALAPNEGAIVSVSSGEHWILAHSGTADQFWIDDSFDEPRTRRVRRSDIAKYNKISLKEGLVLLNT